MIIREKMKKIKLSKNNKRNTYKLLAIYNLNNYDTEYILYDKLMQKLNEYVKRTENIYDLFRQGVWRKYYEKKKKITLRRYKTAEKDLQILIKKFEKYKIFNFVLNDLKEFQLTGRNIRDKSLAVFDSQFIDNGIKGLEYNNINIRNFKLECIENIKKKFENYFWDKYNEFV